MNRFFKRLFSWLFWVNFLFFQWFFIRLARRYDHKLKRFTGWGFIGFMLPLTGWWGNYVWIWKFKTAFKRIGTNRSLSKEDIKDIEERIAKNMTRKEIKRVIGKPKIMEK